MFGENQNASNFFFFFFGNFNDLIFGNFDGL